MKKIALIGDSIRMGYAPLVIEQLAGFAEVWHPDENGGTTRNILDHAAPWITGRGVDLFHINAGLHDIAKGFVEGDLPDGLHRGKPRVNVDDYERNVAAILAAAKATGAAVIWALTTPVNEQWHHATKGFDRFEADVASYNAAARRAAEAAAVPINDLHAVITAAGRDNLLTPDGVHFKPEGSILLADTVARRIRASLA